MGLNIKSSHRFYRTCKLLSLYLIFQIFFVITWQVLKRWPAIQHAYLSNPIDLLSPKGSFCRHDMLYVSWNLNHMPFNPCDPVIFTCRVIHKFIRSNTFAHSSTWLVLAPSFCSLAELNHMIIDSKKSCTLYMVCLNQMVFITFTMTRWLSDLTSNWLVT